MRMLRPTLFLFLVLFTLATGTRAARAGSNDEALGPPVDTDQTSGSSFSEDGEDEDETDFA